MKQVINVTAEMTILSSVQREQFIPVETVTIKGITLKDLRVVDIFSEPEIFIKALIGVHVRGHFVRMIRERLNTDLALKNKINGKRWSVDLLNMKYEIVEVPNA